MRVCSRDFFEAQSLNSNNLENNVLLRIPRDADTSDAHVAIFGRQYISDGGWHHARQGCVLDKSSGLRVKNLELHGLSLELGRLQLRSESRKVDRCAARR